MEKEWEIEFQIILSQKGLSWFKISFKIEKNNNGDIFFNSRVFNITEQKDLEIKLQISEQHSLFVQEISNSGIWD